MTPRSFRRLAALLFLCLRGVLGAATADWSVRVWQAENLFGQRPTLTQTPDGFIWLSTYRSLTRFDGANFDTFPIPSLQPAPTDRLRILSCCHNGDLFLAFESGLVARLPGGGAKPTRQFLLGHITESVTEDGEGALWLTCREPQASPSAQRKICRIKNDELTWFGPAQGAPAGRYYLSRDSDGGIWFANDGAVGRIRGERFEIVAHLPPNTTRLTGDLAGGMWIASGLGLYHFSAAAGLQPHGALPVQNSGTRPTVLLCDRHGALWIATSSDGLYRYADGQFENVPLSHTLVTSLLEDREGNVWAATPAGLNCIQPRAIRFEGGAAGLPAEAIRWLCETSDHVVWGATQDGLLAMRAENGWQVVSREGPLEGRLVSCLAADHEGGMWIGTHNYALFRWHAGQFTSWGAPEGVHSRSARVMFVSRRGEIWIAWSQPDAVQCWRAGKLQNVALPAIAQNIVAITEDTDGTIWIATAIGELLHTSPDGLRFVPFPLPGLRQKILSLHGAADGSLWIGYAKRGVGRLKNGVLEQIGAAQGLPGLRISQILADDTGTLWFASERGLVHVREAAAGKVAAEWPERAPYVAYPVRNDAAGVALGDPGGALRTHDGRLWMPLGPTLAIIDPARLGEPAAPPPVVLKTMKVDGLVTAVRGGIVPVPRGGEFPRGSSAMQLRPDHRKVEFEFAALSFRAPENVRFRHRLEGFDEDWIDTPGRHSAAYSRLAPGDYRFRVIACNGDGVWNNVGATLAFSVTPFLWQRAWFIGGVVVFGAVGLAIGIRYVSFRRLRRKVRALEQQAALAKERARISRDIHDDVGGNLTKILLLTELATRDRANRESVSGRIGDISSAAREAIKSLDETVWAINPRHDTLADLVTYLGQFAVSFLQNAHLACRLEVPDQPPPHTVAAEVRHNLFLATKEALHNVIRHAKATEVVLSITADDAGLVIEVHDDGEGFSAAPANSTADGLRNMRERLQEIGGRFDVQSAAHRGTRITLSYPWKP